MLLATILPLNTTDQYVVWETGNKKVATVNSDGVVTGMKKGTATITAILGKKKVKCKVKVGGSQSLDTYRITSKTKKTAMFTGTKSIASFIKIPATVKLQGVVYKVTEIASGALKGNRKITIKSKKLKSVGKNIFRGISKKAKIKVPKKKLKAYQKLLKKKGQDKQVKIVV